MSLSGSTSSFLLTCQKMFNLEKVVDISGQCLQVLGYSLFVSEKCLWEQNVFYFSIIRLIKPLEHKFSTEKECAQSR
jgi:hypothetical protein